MKARNTGCLIFSRVAWHCSLLRLVATAMVAMFFLPAEVRAAAIDPNGFGINGFVTQGATIGLPGIGPVTFSGFSDPNNALFPLPFAIHQTDPSFRIGWAGPLVSQVGPGASDNLGDSFLFRQPGFFDTLIQRDPATRAVGIGATLDVSIEILWLSLRSTQPVMVPGLGPAFVYVGLDAAAQTPGVMRLTSIPIGGYFGWVDIGTVGFTTDDPSAAGFLGLPVTYDAVYVPLDPTAAVLRQDGLQAVFHSAPEAFHSGVYDVMPEPSALLLVAGGSLILMAFGRRGANRNRKNSD